MLILRPDYFRRIKGVNRKDGVECSPQSLAKEGGGIFLTEKRGRVDLDQEWMACKGAVERDVRAFAADFSLLAQAGDTPLLSGGAHGLLNGCAGPA